jgi:N4-(beta-N-acetylglucosaminyl)-L-asparaginase
MPDRRKFLQLLGLFTVASAIKSNAAKRRQTLPIAIATWDSGVEVAQETFKQLQQNKPAIDAIEKGANFCEAQQSCCVGLGANPDRDGKVTLDASIMNHEGNAGSVAFLQGIKYPTSVARKIMETTPHVMLVGKGAQQFAIQNGFKLQADKLSKNAKLAYTNWLKKSEYKPTKNIEAKNNGNASPTTLPSGIKNHDTMGILALDNLGNVSGACTTSGMAFKMHGRVGDSPIIGSGLFVDNEVGAVTATGIGEEVIKICGSHLIIELMRAGKSPTEACKIAIERIAKRNPIKGKDMQVAFIALNKNGDHGGYSLTKNFMYAVYSENQQQLIYTDYHFTD